MRLIDDRGRLFGKINIFDLFVLCLFAATIVLAFKWAAMAEDPSWVNVKSLHTRCIAVAEIPVYMADLVQEGDEALNDDGLVVAKIEKVISNESNPVIVYQSKDGEKMFFNPKARNVTVEIDLLSYQKKGNIYGCISGVPIQVGAGISMTAKKYSCQFSILKVLKTQE